MTDLVLILTTVPAGEPGETIARTLVDERLAACVNLQAPMTSFYRWKGRLEQDVERQLLIKTTVGRVTAIQTRLAQLHSYELPEFVVLPVADGAAAYLDWIRQASAESGAAQ
jgi:periplasmic divalent cation tolerance protein